MTTQHDEESLEQALWFFLTLSSPTPPLEDTTCAGLVVVVGSDSWARHVEEGLGDPEALTGRALEDDA